MPVTSAPERVRFEAEVIVRDPTALYAQAARKAQREGLPPSEIMQTLCPNGEIDVPACVLMLVDIDEHPAGCDVVDSFTEEG